jgi:hypothetical protein
MGSCRLSFRTLGYHARGRGVSQGSCASHDIHHFHLQPIGQNKPYGTTQPKEALTTTSGTTQWTIYMRVAKHSIHEVRKYMFSNADGELQNHKAKNVHESIFLYSRE